MVKATKVVEAALKTTGPVAGVTGTQIEKMAGAQARSTGVDKAAILESDVLLLLYTNVKNAAGATNDVFNRTGQAGPDMAPRWQGDRHRRRAWPGPRRSSGRPWRTRSASAPCAVPGST